jgi:hypothetical protein
LTGGGGGINTTEFYYVVNANGSTFQVSTLPGGAPTGFLTNITAGTLHNGWEPAVVISQNTPEANSDFILTPKGNGAFILGPEPDNSQAGGVSRGQYAVDLQIRRTASNQVASGQESFVTGLANIASHSYSVAAGYGNISSEIASVALGGLNQATGRGSFAAGGSTTGGTGGNTASGFHSSCPGGIGALADRHAQQSHASGFFSAIGDSQRTRFVLRARTTTNSAVELFLNIASLTRLTIPSGKIFAFTINISGVKSDGTAVAHYLRQYCLKNVAGTTSQVYAPVTIGSDNAAGTSIALSANDTNDALKVEVTGVLNETWRWVAAVDAVEIAYGT